MSTPPPAGADPHPSGRHGLAPSLAALAALSLLLFSDAVFHGRVFFERDVQLVWHAQIEAFVESVAAGSWPLWDPHVAFGHPMLANPNAQVLYPPTWLNLLMGPTAYYRAYVVAHFFLGAAGVLLLGQRLGLSKTAALGASAVFALSGPFLSLVNVWHHFASAAFVPWVFLGAEGAVSRPAPRSLVVFAGALSLQALAGSPDVSLLTVLAVIGFVLAHPSGGLATLHRRCLAPLAVAGVLTVGLTAAQWLPSLEVTLRSARAGLAEGQRAVSAVHPLGLAQVLTPVVWTELPLSDDFRIRFFDGGHPFLRSLYLGLPAVVLVAAGFLAPSRARRGFWIALGLAAGAYSLGERGLLYPVLAEVLPPVRALRYPSKAFVMAAFAWSMLCGIGLEAVKQATDASSRRRRRLALLPGALAVWAGALAAGAAALPVAGLASALAPEALRLGSSTAVLAPVARAMALTTIFGLAALVLASLASWPPARRAAAVGAIVAADLFLAHWGMNRTVAADFYRYRPPLLDVVAGERDARVFVRRYSMGLGATLPALPGRNPYEVRGYPEGMSLEAGRALAVRLYALPPTGGSFKLDGSFDPDLLGLYPRSLQELVDQAVALEDRPAFLRLLRLGAVGHVSMLHPTDLAELQPAGVFQSLLTAPIRIYQVAASLPRAYLVPAARVVGHRDVFPLLVSEAFDPAREVVLESAAPLPMTSAEAGPFRGESRTETRAPDRLRVRVEASAPAYLVVADTYDPGWKATVDGRDAPLLRANLAFRAVPVDAGRHTVEMRYRPAAVVIGLAISGLTAMVAGAALVARRTS